MRILTETIEKRATAEGYRLMRNLTRHVASRRRVPVNFDALLRDLLIDASMFAMSAAIVNTSEELDIVQFSFEREIFEGIPIESYDRIAGFLSRGAESLVQRDAPRIRFALITAVNEMLEGNISYREGLTLVRKRLEEVGAAASNFYRVDTLITTAIHEAYNSTRRRLAGMPDVWAQIWGFRYITRGDDRVRPSHYAQHGVTLPKDDPFWAVWWPPNGYNCRCTTEILANSAKIKQPDREFLPDDGFAAVSPLLNLQNLEFSYAGPSTCPICG